MLKKTLYRMLASDVAHNMQVWNKPIISYFSFINTFFKFLQVAYRNAVDMKEMTGISYVLNHSLIVRLSIKFRYVYILNRRPGQVKMWRVSPRLNVVLPARWLSSTGLQTCQLSWRNLMFSSFAIILWTIATKIVFNLWRHYSWFLFRAMHLWNQE